MDENKQANDINIVISGNSNHVIEINDDDDDDDVEYMDFSRNELSNNQNGTVENINDNNPEQSSVFNNIDQVFSEDDDLYDRAHKISNLISRALKSNVNDPNIRELQKKRRGIWQQIENMESSIQNNLPFNSNNGDNYSILNGSTPENGFINQDNYQPSFDEIPCAYELFPEDHKCQNPEIERIITEININNFHHERFRGCQAAAIESAINGKDVFVIMPTGGGKSLIYQLPGFYQKNLTVVISPLISLIKDQVESLQSMGFSATALSGFKSKDSVIINDIKKSKFFFLFITPEKLDNSPVLRNFLHDMYFEKRITRFVIDEAHCISQWGHDFRKSYYRLSLIRKEFPDVPIMALTATATGTVKQDIIDVLNIQDCDKYQTSFNRPNIIMEVVVKKDKKSYDLILEYIKEKNFENKCGIIFCLSRDDAEKLSAWLNEHGLNTHYYHGQMKNQQERSNVQRLWMEDQIKIIVATTAFGMGIDKPDVRFVIHQTMPFSIESYYQGIGRAGRDGQLSYCLLLYSSGDLKDIMKLISNTQENNEIISHERLQLKYELVDSMSLFCLDKKKCRRAQIMNYFGEEFDETMCNKTCDNCINHETGLIQFEEKDELEAAKILAKIVCRIQYKRGDASPNATIGYVIKVFNGSNETRTRDSNDYELPEFGEGKKAFPIKEQTLYEIVFTLVSRLILKYKVRVIPNSTITYLVIGDDFNKYFNVEQSPKNPREVNITEKNVFFPSISIFVPNDKPPFGMNPVDENLYRNLIRKREKLALTHRLANPTAIIKASTLRIIVFKKPKDLESLFSTETINQDEMNKLKKYGKEFVQTVIDSLAQQIPANMPRPKSNPSIPRQPVIPPPLNTSNLTNSFSFLKKNGDFAQSDLKNSINPNYTKPNIQNVMNANLQNNNIAPTINLNQNNTNLHLTNKSTQKVPRVNFLPQENQISSNNNNNNNEDNEDFSFLNDADFIEQQKMIWKSFEKNNDQAQRAENHSNSSANANQNVVDLTVDDSDEGSADQNAAVSKQRESFFSRLKKSNNE